MDAKIITLDANLSEQQADAPQQDLLRELAQAELMLVGGGGTDVVFG